jgi:phosphoribosylformylglycinamidine cyclo-ligase
MCVNDVIVQGAEPLFFLDYFATGKLDVNASASVVTGIAEGCKQAGAALIGGETAEMPGMYADGEYDLAGFCVGIVDKDKLITGNNIVAGDVILGMHSSGVHSNGFSLVNKLIEQKNLSLDDAFENSTLGATLLTPTQIYVKILLEILAQQDVHGLCHITGGGLTENLPRIIPEHLLAEIDLASWERLPVFKWIQEQGQVEESEMLRVFNCGIGMTVITPANSIDDIMRLCSAQGIQASVIGKITGGQGPSLVRYI